MHTIQDVKENYQEVFEFKCESDDAIYKRDKQALKILNKILDASFKVVYRNKRYIKDQKGNGHFSWDGEIIYVITSSGKLICFQNSEWASFSIE